MSRRMQSYVLVRGGQIISRASLDPDFLPTTLPPGVTLMTEAAALVQGIGRPGGGDDDTTRAQQALVIDYLMAQRASDVSDNASTVAGGNGAVTLAQLTATVRLLAGWIALLARHDLMTQRQLMALILRDPSAFGPIGLSPAAVSVPVTPADATASGSPVTITTT